MFQGLSPNYHGEKYDVVFPGSEMPEWFSHQCMGKWNLFLISVMSGWGLLFALYFVLFHVTKFIMIQFSSGWEPMEKICLLQVEWEEFGITTFPKIWLLYQIIFGCYICFLNTSGRRTENHCGNVMQMDSVRLELKLRTHVQAWWRNAGCMWYTRKTLKISTILWFSVTTTTSFLMRAWKSPW